MDKKTEAQAKADFNLHVLLICKQDNVRKSNAVMRAWMEGESGLKARLNPKQPVEATQQRPKESK